VTPGKSGTRVSGEKYEAFRKAILAVVPRNQQGIPFRDLPALVAKQVPKEFLRTRGSASWYTTVVKLDLEAQGVLQRLPGVVPQHLRRLK